MVEHATSAAGGADRVRPAEPDHEVVIIGAGFAGLGTAIALQRQGIGNFVILERNSEVGGTWQAHSYPGLAVDVPSIVFSYHFDMNPDWTRIFAPGAELFQYARDIADRHALRENIELKTEVVSAEFDDIRHFWRVRTADGRTFTGRFLFSCHGILVTPRAPQFPGLESYTGKVLHSMRWDHDYELNGKRVAVIGTGATGLQIIPTIAPDVHNLTVYQRTPIWVVPKVDAPVPPLVRQAFRRAPCVQKGLRVLATGMTELILTISVVHHKQAPWLAPAVQRLCTAFLNHQIPPGELREKLTPQYKFGCKRPSFSNVYYKAYLRDNVELVTDPIECFTVNGIRTADGQEREFDAVVMATGFKLFDVPYDLRGTDGVSLNDFWDAERRQTYEGTSVHGYPNMFLVPGPYAVSGSWFSTIDLCVTHAVRVIKEARRRGATRAEISASALQAAHTATVRRAQQTVYLDPGCGHSNSYYIDQHGDAPFLRPMSTVTAWLRQRRFDLNDYDYESCETRSSTGKGRRKKTPSIPATALP